MRLKIYRALLRTWMGRSRGDRLVEEDERSQAADIIFILYLESNDL